MKYSYTSARKKKIVTPELQLLFIFFGITLFMLFSTYAFLLFKDYRFLELSRDIVQKRFDLNISLSSMKSKITFIEKELALSERVYTQNTVLKDSIANLFDLVPQRITLSEASLLKNGLILYGITPSKDVYNFMLQAPLRSIFHKNYSSFYPDKNGWLRFVSTNYIEENDIQNYDLKSEDLEEQDTNEGLE
ncbi:MAG: hypothetical protein AUK54_10280 [Helicobacteraceae bacterium CG2_30_36_10]|nr:MAG: hypothetical protein AUK54_10280 [Helicobacteraceae bacterium CG2_30_36_10]